MGTLAGKSTRSEALTSYVQDADFTLYCGDALRVLRQLPDESVDCGHGDYRAGVICDPFLGSGTTALVARRLGRACVGIELSPEYAAMAAERLQQLSLLAESV